MPGATGGRGVGVGLEGIMDLWLHRPVTYRCKVLALQGGAPMERATLAWRVGATPVIGPVGRLRVLLDLDQR